MNKKDILLQLRMPTVMAPRFEPLEPCPMGMTRLLMAEAGLYLESAQPWGVFREIIWESPRLLPYGPVEPQDGFAAALRKSFPEWRDIVPAATRAAEVDKEWAGWIVWREDRGFFYWPVGHKATPVSADYDEKLPDGTCLVADIHSHGRLDAYFSENDDQDDALGGSTVTAEGVKMSIILGKYDRSSPFPFREVALRYVIRGFLYPKDFSEILSAERAEECDDSNNAQKSQTLPAS